MELFKASAQWSKRPVDERFSNLQDMHKSCKGYADQATEAELPWADIRMEVVDGDVQLLGRTGIPARLTHWAFGQVSRALNAPADYMRTLPATLAVQNLNHGLKSNESVNDAQLMFHKNGHLLLRSITSNQYARIWNWEIIERLLPFQENGWKVPPARPATGDPRARPATEADIIEAGDFGLSVKVGDMIAPAGLYASDHDMFVFMVNPANRVNDGSDGGLSRGFFVENSEVGASSLKITQFLYRHVCGNHIVWGAENVQEISIRHRGNRVDRRAWYMLQQQIARNQDSGVSGLEAKIKAARRGEIAATKALILDKLFGARITSKQNLEDAMTIAERHEKTDGNPYSYWGMTQGLTRLSQQTVYADKRAELDRAAGKVLKMAF